MTGARPRIAVVAPSARLDPQIAARIQAKIAQAPAEARLELVFHPQCFASAGHFAGADSERAAAFLEVARDPRFDAVWFARGGYGAARIAETVIAGLNEAAREKIYLGYSDGGCLLAALSNAGVAGVAHGPMPADLAREGGEAAVARALAFLAGEREAGIEPSVLADPATPTAAFNITVLSHLVATPLEPRLAGRVVMLEEVSEHLYAIDRALFQIFSSPLLREARGVRLGRCSAIPENDRPFGEDETAIVKRWSAHAGVAYLGRADIGHDPGNSIVPFGALATFPRGPGR